MLAELIKRGCEILYNVIYTPRLDPIEEQFEAGKGILMMESLLNRNQIKRAIFTKAIAVPQETVTKYYLHSFIEM